MDRRDQEEEERACSDDAAMSLDRIQVLSFASRSRRSTIAVATYLARSLLDMRKEADPPRSYRAEDCVGHPSREGRKPSSKP